MRRRAFLSSAASLAVFAAGTGLPTGLGAAALRIAARKRSAADTPTLVCIFQRGAMDGLSAVQPLDDPALRAARPQLWLSPTETNRAGKALLPLDDRFGLNATLAPLLPYYRDGQLAIVHGVGQPVEDRSHFDMQDYLENGTPGVKSTASGWLNRLGERLPGAGTPFRAMSLTTARPRSLYGTGPAISVSQLDALTLQGGAAAHARLKQQWTTGNTPPELARPGAAALEAARLLESRQVTRRPRPAAYPDSPLGNSLAQIAQLIRAGVGLEIAFAESNGWDSHSYQVGPLGGFTRLADDLAQSMAAFWEDLGPHRSQTLVMTMTEFGRTVAENGSRGTDHGRASCQFILGERVAGGRIYGDVPANLVAANLEAGRDLPVTTDYRAVFGGIARDHLGVRTLDGLFPGYAGRPLGLLR